MVIVIEPICVGDEHVPVNTAMLRIISAVHPDEPIFFYAERAHLDLVLAALPPTLNGRITGEAVDTPPRRSSFWTRLRFEYPLLRSALERARGHTAYVVCLCAQESMILALKAQATLRREPVFGKVVLHTHVASLEGWRSRNPLVRMHDLKSAMMLGNNRGLAYLFLEESITRRVKGIIPSAASSFFSLPHPILPNELKAKKEYTPSLPLKIGFLGQTTTHKGYPQFLEIAAEMKRRRSGKIEFHVFGSISEETRHLSTDALDTAPAEHQLTRTEFLDGLSRLHYVCLPFTGKHYNLTASGVLLDALASCTPMLALPQPSLKSIFMSASPGVLTESIDQLIDYLTRFIDAPDWSLYQFQSEEAHRLALARDCASLESVYRSIPHV